MYNQSRLRTICKHYNVNTCYSATFYCHLRSSLAYYSKMSSTETEADTGASGYVRKRLRNVENWKKTKVKRARNTGQAYIGRRSQKYVAARIVGPECNCHCFNKVGRDNVKEIFDNFWNISNYDLQNNYISKLVTSIDVKRCRIKNRPSRIKRSINYTIIYNNTVHKVCRIAFYHIHGITEKRVRTVLDKQLPTGVTDIDNRGRTSSNKISTERRQSVIEHINSIPKVTSHYSRAKSPHRKYLPPGLNMNTMYILYLDWLKDNNSNIEPVTNHYYRDVFNEFNIGFEPPRSDTCNYCDQVNNEIRALNVATESADINRLQGEKQHHLAVSKEVHHILKACKTIEDPSVGAIAFDLQQTLPTPKLTTGVQYYKRKLWTYNFGVHNIKTGRSVMYLWNEADGKRGSAEITSCVMHYINNSVDINIKTLKMFSDNCGGQNKNINMVLTCLRKIHEGRFDKIEHFFMVPGHSYLPCDRDFGNIESKVRGIEVFSQPNYADIIKACRKTRPFKVVNMPRNLFLDVEVLQTSITNRTKTGCSFSHGRVFIYDAKYKQGFGIKASYHQAEPLC